MEKLQQEPVMKKKRLSLERVLSAVEENYIPFRSINPANDSYFEERKRINAEDKENAKTILYSNVLDMVQIGRTNRQIASALSKKLGMDVSDYVMRKIKKQAYEFQIDKSGKKQEITALTAEYIKEKKTSRELAEDLSFRYGQNIIATGRKGKKIALGYTPEFAAYVKRKIQNDAKKTLQTEVSKNNEKISEEPLKNEYRAQDTGKVAYEQAYNPLQRIAFKVLGKEDERKDMLDEFNNSNLDRVIAFYDRENRVYRKGDKKLFPDEKKYFLARGWEPRPRYSISEKLAILKENITEKLDFRGTETADSLMTIGNFVKTFPKNIGYGLLNMYENLGDSLKQTYYNLTTPPNPDESTLALDS